MYFRFLGVICVEVPLPDLAPELEERARIRDGVCLGNSQKQGGQHGNPQPWRLEPVHVFADPGLRSWGEGGVRMG